MSGRPEALFSYFKDVESLAGVGPRLASAFARLVGRRVRDILFHSPVSVIDRSRMVPVASALAGQRVTLTVTIHAHHSPANSRSPYRIDVGDDSAAMMLVFFRGRGDWLLKQFPVGDTRIISGVVEDFGGTLQMTHPEYVVSPGDSASMPAFEPVYPLTAGLSNKVLRKALLSALDMVPSLGEWQDVTRRDQRGWPDFAAALRAIHTPDSAASLDPASPARARLAYDELLADQLAIALVRGAERARKGRITAGGDHVASAVQAALPYRLTGDQQQALADIVGDMKSDKAMLRLMQGDVGSGKTVVALLAAAYAVAGGHQAALLAPTEILAQQHVQSLEAMGTAAGIRVALLTGRVKGKARAALLAKLAAGEIDLLVGTHALIQDDVAFHDLALAIIDEQHRFGVGQRLKLTQKGAGVDVLGMTATPIPRTLTMALFGDMDVSRITEKPPGRKPIVTRVISQDRLGDVIRSLQRAFADGTQAYWVTPLVAESEDTDLAAAESRFEDLQAVFGDRVAMLHGQMPARDKDAVMARFAGGEVSLLVATTVIEVGVDVPAASIMIIEGAERFGLAQLHQLRGRVGRGDQDSSCVLVRGNRLSDIAQQRLKVLRDSEDGFFLAEEDLRLRGAGEILGRRQSGLPVMHFADLMAHGDLLAEARSDARYMVEMGGLDHGVRGDALRHLLYLFERDEGVKLIRSG